MNDFGTVGETMRALASTMEGEYGRVREGEDLMISPAEVELREAFSRLGLPVQQQVPCGPYSMDFFFPDERLCVEVDGRHHEQRLREDGRRDAYLEEMGIATRRIPAKAVFTDSDAEARNVGWHLARIRRERQVGLPFQAKA